jgi:methylated-DNA-[protein]-cysteine S-methyltransferase
MSVLAIDVFNHALFETAIGTCALAWGDEGIVGVHLPEATQEETVSRLLARFPRAQRRVPDGAEAEAIRAFIKLIETGRGQLLDIKLDMRAVPDFNRVVYRHLRQVPPGQTTTYGELAKLAGDKGAARAVGIAMAKNPWPIIVPCHRVLASEGKSGGFSGGLGVATKIRLLQGEGALLI